MDESAEKKQDIDEYVDTLDPNQIKNLTLQSSTKRNQHADSVSQLAIRVLTKIIILWDDQIV
jgi:hypothetical protein